MFGLHLHSTVHYRRKSGRSLEAGADAEATEVCCLLACLACFPIEPRPTSPELAPSTMVGGLGPSPSILQKCSTGLPYSPDFGWKALSQLRFSPLRGLCQGDTKLDDRASPLACPSGQGSLTLFWFGSAAWVTVHSLFKLSLLM